MTFAEHKEWEIGSVIGHVVQVDRMIYSFKSYCQLPLYLLLEHTHGDFMMLCESAAEREEFC